jgi:hypothetical protein
MGNSWARLTSAVREGRVTSGIRRRFRQSGPAQFGLEQYLRISLRHLPRRCAGVPCICLRGDFTKLPESCLLKRAFDEAMDNVDGLADFVRQIDGMSGQKYRTLINSLVKYHPDARYLEVGSWSGSTAASAMYGNTVKVLCIDNWSQFGGPKALFFENIERVCSPSVKFTFIESDFRQVDYNSLGFFNIYLFDGPHEEQDQYDGITTARPALDRRVIVIVDDWNWPSVRIGTFRALYDMRYSIESSIEIRTTLDNSHPSVEGKNSDWHNGYFLAVCTLP